MDKSGYFRPASWGRPTVATFKLISGRNEGAFVSSAVSLKVCPPTIDLRMLSIYIRMESSDLTYAQTYINTGPCISRGSITKRRRESTDGFHPSFAK